MANAQSSLLERILNRVFPKSPDFFTLLALQSEHVGMSVSRMVEFMETGDARTGELVRNDEHEADRIKIHNIHVLNEAFSTPIDREDIYRAIMDLDEIVDYCKSTVNEMEVLGLKPDKHSLEFSIHVKEGVNALTNGFAKLKTNPAAAAADAVRRIREGRTEGPAPSRMMARRGIEELRRQLAKSDVDGAQTACAVLAHVLGHPEALRAHPALAAAIGAQSGEGAGKRAASSS